MKIRIKDVMVETKKFVPSLSNKFSFMSEGAVNDYKNHNKRPISIIKQILEPVESKCGLKLRNITPNQLDQKLCFGIGRNPKYKLISYLRWHDFATKEAEKIYEPDSKGEIRFIDGKYIKKIYMFDPSLISKAIDTICEAYKNGDLKL